MDESRKHDSVISSAVSQNKTASPRCPGLDEFSQMQDRVLADSYVRSLRESTLRMKNGKDCQVPDGSTDFIVSWTDVRLRELLSRRSEIV